MANTSILAAFERMWQHVVVALNNKSDKSEMKALQTLVGDTSVSEQVESAIAGLDGYIYAEEFNSEATMAPLNADTLGGHPVEDFITKQTLPLGIEHGGTGATSAEVARQNLGITPENIGAEPVGAMRMELLWENASPSSEFTAQKITFDKKGFTTIAIESNEGTVFCSGNVNSSFSKFASEAYTYRNFTIHSDGITFDYCYARWFSGSSQVYNAGSVPLRIYGIKGVS